MKRKVKPLEEDIRQMERQIEGLCLKVLLQQQSVAGDLRQISAALKMVTDLRRIGEQSDAIAGILAGLAGHGQGECKCIKGMAQASIQMVTESIDAFVRQDVSMAEKAIDHDDMVDAYFHEVKKALIAVLSARPEEWEYALDLLMTAKYYERMGDHAAHIAAWVIFAITGEHRGKPHESCLVRGR